LGILIVYCPDIQRNFFGKKDDKLAIKLWKYGNIPIEIFRKIAIYEIVS